MIAAMLLAVLLSAAVAQGGFVRPDKPSHRPVYVKVAAPLPCLEISLGQMLLPARRQFAKCAAGKMGSAIFMVQTGPKAARVVASEGSLNAKARACMSRKVLTKQRWPKDKCAIKVTIRAD